MDIAQTPFVTVSWEAAEADAVAADVAVADAAVDVDLSGGWALSTAFLIIEWISSEPWTTLISNDQTGTPVPESDDSRGLEETSKGGSLITSLVKISLTLYF